MSYLVLARKYRPTSFADIVGQEHVVRTLANAIKLGRVHHAFLFTGARGVGKTTTARVMARALNCEKGPTIDPCGSCAACLDILSGASPDVLEIDGASNTGVDNVRELRETVRYLPSKGRYKLYIIDEVHMLSTAAFNALLKTLEEPPPHVKFIFATTEPHKIPVTILSRCQRFDFRRVSVAMLVEHVRAVLDKEKVSFSSAALTSIVREAQGSVRDALSLLDQVLSFAGESPDDAAVAQALGIVERQTIFELASAVLERNAPRLLSLVAEVDARGHDLTDVAGLLVEHFRDLMVAKVVPEPASALPERSPGEVAQLVEQAAKASRPDLHRQFSLLVAAAEDVQRSQQQRVSLEMGLLRLLEVEPTLALAELIARLDALGAGGASGSGSSSPSSGGVRPSTSTSTPRALSSAPAATTSGTREAGSGARDAGSGTRDAGSGTREAGSGAREASSGALDERSPDSLRAERGGIGGPRFTGAPEYDPWARFVERVKKARPAVASVLEHGRMLRFGPDGVELGYAPSSFYWEKARDEETRDFLQRTLEEQFGQAVALSIRAVEDAASAPASLAEQSAERRQKRERDIKDTALAHPVVQGAISILGGHVTDVVPIINEDEPA